MEGIIDVHAHILPGVDDGPSDWEEAVWMLKCSYEQGIRTIIVTPHYSRKQDPERLRKKAKDLAKEAACINSDFRILLGQEIMYFDSIVERLQEGHALTLAESRHVLVEFLPNTSYKKIYQGVRKIMMAGYYPVIAHVERYETLRDEENMEELAETGCMMQMNYRSLQGTILNRNVRWCRRQVLDGRISLFGTDAHHRDFRTPEIAGSLHWLQAHMGESLSPMIRDHALGIINQGIQVLPVQESEN